MEKLIFLTHTMFCWLLLQIIMCYWFCGLGSQIYNHFAVRNYCKGKHSHIWLSCGSWSFIMNFNLFKLLGKITFDHQMCRTTTFSRISYSICPSFSLSHSFNYVHNARNKLCLKYSIYKWFLKGLFSFICWLLGSLILSCCFVVGVVLVNVMSTRHSIKLKISYIEIETSAYCAHAVWRAPYKYLNDLSN